MVRGRHKELNYLIRMEKFPLRIRRKFFFLVFRGLVYNAYPHSSSSFSVAHEEEQNQRIEHANGSEWLGNANLPQWHPIRDDYSSASHGTLSSHSDTANRAETRSLHNNCIQIRANDLLPAQRRDEQVVHLSEAEAAIVSQIFELQPRESRNRRITL